ILTSKRNSTESNAPLHMFSILVVLLIPYVQAWGCKDNPNVEGFPWSACLKVTPDGEQADLIDAPWRGPPGYDCSMDAEGGHDIPTCCSKHEEDMPKILSQETLKKDCKHLDGRPFEWPPSQNHWTRGPDQLVLIMFSPSIPMSMLTLLGSLAQSGYEQFCPLLNGTNYSCKICFSSLYICGNILILARPISIFLDSHLDYLLMSNHHSRRMLLIPYVQAWGCKDNPKVPGYPWSACLKVNYPPDADPVADLIDAPWRGPPGYDCSMDVAGGHYIPTCCSKHEEDMPKLLNRDTLLKDCKHLDGSPFEWPPKPHNW
ncbi:hypothetical protein PSHT_08766, partial [Puccinia striiformis]